AFLTIVFALMAGGRVYFRHLYPYGSSHSCTIILGNALRAYAEDHDGFFPSGEATPEASLGLLYSNYADPYQLSGKTVPVKITKQTLIAGKPLDSSSCSWHYVEGLHEDDDLRIALVWDKVAGLGHNGWRLKDSGREVVLVGGNTDYIHGDQWDHFLSEQQELLANRPETLKRKTPS